ncbi:hypothetical protein L207DRAFT_188328 [Hyaloscypha variabilis F]|uniref:Uncharacterized protein n=1 Tax=Hyaloscypha variabilis (strain UAMH 11265 / GT02V1 / F) TaxID=1149755 RepID=A0A2J6QYV5_HYAVF|nr:hypothetical protein L207DRAFT_188328 [Hyaloscypha variabilis F]
MPTVAYLVAFSPSPPTLGTQQSAPKGNPQQAGDVHSFIRLADYYNPGDQDSDNCQALTFKSVSKGSTSVQERELPVPIISYPPYK